MAITLIHINFYEKHNPKYLIVERKTNTLLMTEIELTYLKNLGLKVENICYTNGKVNGKFVDITRFPSYGMVGANFDQYCTYAVTAVLVEDSGEVWGYEVIGTNRKLKILNRFSAASRELNLTFLNAEIGHNELIVSDSIIRLPYKTYNSKPEIITKGKEVSDENGYVYCFGKNVSGSSVGFSTIYFDKEELSNPLSWSVVVGDPKKLKIGAPFHKLLKGYPVTCADLLYRGLNYDVIKPNLKNIRNISIVQILYGCSVNLLDLTLLTPKQVEMVLTDCSNNTPYTFINANAIIASEALQYIKNSTSVKIKEYIGLKKVVVTNSYSNVNNILLKGKMLGTGKLLIVLGNG